MYKAEDSQGHWFSSHLFRINFQAVGDTPEAVRTAHQDALDKGRTKKRWLGGTFPIGEDSGLAINRIDRWTLKAKEWGHKIGSLIPMIGGLVFLNNALQILRESGGSGGPDTVIGGFMGIVGLAAISIFPVLGFQAGETYRQMHDWMKHNGDMKQAYFGQTFFPGQHH